jgi:hypothetical protein
MGDMMKNLLIILFIAITLVSCKGLDGTNGGDGTNPESGISFTIEGAAQKGPYQPGTQVSIQGLDSTFAVIAGENASTTVQDDLGNFSSALTLPQSIYGDILACGFFWDELTGAYTQERFCSSSLLLPNTGPYNLNIVTSMTKERVKELRASLPATTTDQEILDQATSEFINEALGFTTYPSIFTLSANNWNINDDSPLLTLSGLTLGGSIQDLEGLVASIANDFADGTLTQAHKDFYQQKSIALNPATVEANVSGKFGQVGDITRWLTKLDPSRLVSIKQTQGRGAQTNYTMIGGPMHIGIPFSSGVSGLSFDYTSFHCPSIVAEIWSHDGTLVPATLLHTGTVGANLLPPRSYPSTGGDLVIAQNQASFTGVSLAANSNFWMILNVSSCPTPFNDPSPHSKVIRSNDGGTTYTLDFNGWTGTPQLTFLK